jgi:hypothetical protein
MRRSGRICQPQVQIKIAFSKMRSFVRRSGYPCGNDVLAVHGSNNVTHAGIKKNDSRCEHRNKPHHYSITSSAATNRVGEISTPNALAVLRLMTKLESLLDGHIARLLTTQNTINVPGRARKVLKII